MSKAKNKITKNELTRGYDDQKSRIVALSIATNTRGVDKDIHHFQVKTGVRKKGNP